MKQVISRSVRNGHFFIYFAYLFGIGEKRSVFGRMGGIGVHSVESVHLRPENS